MLGESLEKKIKNKRGLWSPDEDQKLKDYILNHGAGCWSSVPDHAGLQRNGKSCRLRWVNYLRPGLKRGSFTIHEDEIIITLHGMLGNKWSLMSHHLPGRTDNEIKNYWHSHLKKKVQKSQNSSCSSNHTITYSSVESSAAYVCKNLPKILFADWLSHNQFPKSDFLVSQKTVLNGELVNEGSFSSHIQQGPSYGFDDYLKHEQQHVETDLCNFIFEEDNMCQNFSDIDAMLYSCKM